MQAPCAALSYKQELVTAGTCLPLFSPRLPHPFTPASTLPSPFNTLHFPSSLPLPPSLVSAQKQPGLGAKAQAVPCRAHMDSGVLLSRARNVVPARRVLSRLTGHSATTTHNNHNPSVPALCLQAVQQMLITLLS